MQPGCKLKARPEYKTRKFVFGDLQVVVNKKLSQVGGQISGFTPLFKATNGQVRAFLELLLNVFNGLVLIFL